MINKLEVLQLAKKLGLQNSTIEKDYVLGWVLIGIQDNSKTKDSWIFKGGTCLKKCFFNEYRFSEDLDFTLVDSSQMNESFLMGILKELSEWIYEETGIEIPPKSLSVEFYVVMWDGKTPSPLGEHFSIILNRGLQAWFSQYL